MKYPHARALVVNQMLDLANKELERGQQGINVALELPSATPDEREERDQEITLALGRASELHAFVRKIIVAVKKELEAKS